jgi:hypothetical protein
MTDIALRQQATVMNSTVMCPYCLSVDTRYAYELTVRHRILPVAGDTIRLHQDCETEDLWINERIECAECGQDSAVPDGYEVAEV